MSTIKRMIVTYRVYKFVRLVDELNEKRIEHVVAQISAGEHVDTANFKLIDQSEAIDQFTRKRVLLKKPNFSIASRACGIAIREKYLEYQDKKDDDLKTRLRVRPVEGGRLLDGVPFFRFGLLKVWYEEHGWLLPLALSAASAGVGLALGYIGKAVLFVVNLRG